MKTVGAKPPSSKKPLRGSGSSNPQPHDQEHVEADPYYTPQLQASRFSAYQSRKLLPFRYADTVWFVIQGFYFPTLLERQGLNNFLELQGTIYPNLVREFYANFQFKDDICESMIKGRKVVMNRKLFRDVGSLVCDGARLSDCNSKAWNNFDALEVYTSCLRNPEQFVRGSLKKAGLLYVEDRILHYLLVYIVGPKVTNYAQCNGRDLQMMYAIKRGYRVDWPAEILRTMYLIITNEKAQPLAYGIFISRIVDYLRIDTSREVVQHTNPKDHLIDDGILHQMGIYNIRGEWVYANDDVEMEDVELPDSGNEDNSEDEAPNVQGPQAPAPDIPAFGLAHLDAMEQRMTARMEGLIQGLGDRMTARIDALEEQFRTDLRLQTETLRAEYTRMHFDDYFQPPSPDHPPNP